MSINTGNLYHYIEVIIQLLCTIPFPCCMHDLPIYKLCSKLRFAMLFRPSAPACILRCITLVTVSRTQLFPRT